jgi:hypothetical protein
MLNVVMLNVVMLSTAMLSVMAVKKTVRSDVSGV